MTLEEVCISIRYLPVGIAVKASCHQWGYCRCRSSYRFAWVDLIPPVLLNLALQMQRNVMRSPTPVYWAGTTGVLQLEAVKCHGLALTWCHPKWKISGVGPAGLEITVADSTSIKWTGKWRNQFQIAKQGILSRHPLCRNFYNFPFAKLIHKSILARQNPLRSIFQQKAMKTYPNVKINLVKQAFHWLDDHKPTDVEHQHNQLQSKFRFDRHWQWLILD